jgi:hypothetical protein
VKYQNFEEVMDEINGDVMYSYPKAQNIFGKCHFEKNTMYPLERYRFGSFELTGVSRGAVKKYFDIISVRFK